MNEGGLAGRRVRLGVLFIPTGTVGLCCRAESVHIGPKVYTASRVATSLSQHVSYVYMHTSLHCAVLALMAPDRLDLPVVHNNSCEGIETRQRLILIFSIPPTTHDPSRPITFLLPAVYYVFPSQPCPA